MVRGQFEVGNTAGFQPGVDNAKDADRRLESISKSKLFREKCLEFLGDGNTGKESGTRAGAFAILREIAEGYKGVKPSDRIAAIGLMLKVGGMLNDKVEVEYQNPFQGMSPEDLVMVAQKLTVAITTKAKNEGNGTSNSSPG